MRRELRTLQVRETTGRQFSQSGCGSKCLKRCNLLQASPGLISQQEHISTSSVSVCGPDSAIHHPSAQISISSRGTRAARLLTLTKRFSSCEGNTDARGTWIDEESNALICGFARRVSVGESEAMAHEQERVCQPWTCITSFTARVTYDAYWEPKKYWNRMISCDFQFCKTVIKYCMMHQPIGATDHHLIIILEISVGNNTLNKCINTDLNDP